MIMNRIDDFCVYWYIVLSFRIFFLAQFVLQEHTPLRSLSIFTNHYRLGFYSKNLLSLKQSF